jgi:site-specific DNA-methyltransferase (cytosine-N4-specific)
VEAGIAGVPAVGIDLHPLACLITKVKVTPLRASLGDAARRSMEFATHAVVKPPSIPAVNHWFKPEIQVALAAIVAAVDTEQDPDIRDALKVALSSIIVRVSNQDSDTRYAAIDKDISAEEVGFGFLRAAVGLGRALSETWASSARPPQACVVNRNILNMHASDIDRPVSLVVTSPPYPNAYEYWLYHKYRMYWLGMDPIGVRAQEIGARPHYFKRNPQTAADFERQMSAVFRLLAAVLRKGGHACFQVGNSVIRGEVIDNAALLQRAAAPHGFVVAASMKRDIPMRRKAFNPSHARIKQEDILVFRLEA